MIEAVTTLSADDRDELISALRAALDWMGADIGPGRAGHYELARRRVRAALAKLQGREAME